MKLHLRPYQTEALDKVAAAETRGVRRQLGVAATGLGKTVMFCSLAEQRRGRTLVLAHRDELVTQAAAKVLEVWPDLGATTDAHAALRAAGHGHLARSVAVSGSGVGIVKAAADDIGAHVVIASVQTLARQARLDRLTGWYADTGMLARHPDAEPFDLVVVDEAHHAAADSYRRVLDALGCGADGGPLLLGVTATPDRGDGQGLDDLFDEVTWSYDILWGIRSGYLADLRGLQVAIDTLDLGAVKVRRGDYDQGQAGRALQAADAPRLVVAAWLEHAMGRRTIVFTPTVDVAREVADEFRHAGVAAGYVHGGTGTDERRQLLLDYSAGRLDVIANCAVLTEGYDEPRTDCIVIARPTRSRALYTQMIGRGTRRHPDKTDCLVLDVVGATAEHSLLTVPSLFGLDAGSEWAGQLGNGTGAVSRVLQARDDWMVAAGRMLAVEADLFRDLRSEGVVWVQVHADGDTLRRYHRPLGAGRNGDQLPTVVLTQRDPTADLWTAGLLAADGGKRVLLADAPMAMAQGVAEDYVRSHGVRALTHADAPWRRRPPSAKALAAARKWRLEIDPAWNAGELSEALDAHIARRRARRA